MKKILLLIGIIFVFIPASCSLINSSSTTTSGPVSTGYPDSVVYKIKVASDTYLCSSYTVNNIDSGISLSLNTVYSMSSDGKITWIAAQKTVSAVTIEKISK